MGLVQWPARFSLRVGLDLVLFIIAVVAGREAARQAVVGIDNWNDVGGVQFWQIVRDRAGVSSISNCSFTTEDVVGGTLTVKFDFPLKLVIPFLPSPPSWQTGTAQASMRIEQLSNPIGPGGC